MEEKSAVYVKDFQRNDLFWGFGIENECYLELINQKTEKKFSDVLLRTRRERYSLDYNTSYNEKIREKEIYVYKDKYDTIVIPKLLNAYAIQNMDMFGEHKTTYETKPKINNKFTGVTILDTLKKNDFFIKEHGLGKNFVFDGDTIEFTTRNFYKTNFTKCIEELIEKRDTFIKEFNKIMPEKFQVQICPVNYGFAENYSNPGQTALFNNGTYHFNITLPTFLDNDAEILDKDNFIKRHINLGKTIQWISPILIAVYGSPDIYSQFSNKYAAGSQRVCGSRYISLGTFDFDNPVYGKYLQEDKEYIYKKFPRYFWLHKLERKSGYILLDKVGLDFNMLKHKNLGIEWRVMDYFDVKFLPEFTNFLLFIIKLSERIDVSNPIYSRRWNKLAYGCVMKGYKFQPKNKIVKKLLKELNLDCYKEWKNTKSKDIKSLLLYIKNKYV